MNVSNVKSTDDKRVAGRMERLLLGRSDEPNHRSFDLNCDVLFRLLTRTDDGFGNCGEIARRWTTYRN